MPFFPPTPEQLLALIYERQELLINLMERIAMALDLTPLLTEVTKTLTESAAMRKLVADKGANEVNPNALAKVVADLATDRALNEHLRETNPPQPPLAPTAPKA